MLRWGVILLLLRKLFSAIFALAAINFIVLAIVGHYDVRFGPIHLAAIYLFKPLLYLNGAFLIVLILQYRGEPVQPAPERESFHPQAWFWAVSIAAIVAVYTVSFWINLDFGDWTHRNITSHTQPWQFFLHKQYDGFYRPLVFTSLWLDYQIFHNTLWGFHIQNVLLHFLNGFLAARLAFRLGLNQRLAAWTGLAFLAVPASFEAVIWPGARFDLMAAAFTLVALERALAGGVVTSAICFALAILCKETAYAYPLILGALFLLRGRLGLPLSKEGWYRVLGVTFAVTLLMLLIRVSIYGNLGGYPDVVKGSGTVNFEFHTKTFTAFATRLPAGVFLINTGAGLPIWLRIDLIAYALLLAYILFSGAGAAGSRIVLLVLSVLAVLPMMNMFGWMTQYAQQGRYLYHPVIWIVIIMVVAISRVRASGIVFPAWIVVMLIAALFNELVYIKMIREVNDVAVPTAERACKNAQCCRSLYLSDVPRDLYGAFYFQHQVVHQLQLDLPGVAVVPTVDAVPESACVVHLRWDNDRWIGGAAASAPSKPNEVAPQ